MEKRDIIFFIYKKKTNRDGTFCSLDKLINKIRRKHGCEWNRIC